MTPPALAPSDPPDSDSFRESGKGRRDLQKSKNQKSVELTFSVNLDRSSLSEESVKPKPSDRSKKTN